MAGTAAYNTDWNNAAPSIGFKWTPDRRDGLLGTLMGSPGDFAIRGGFGRSFQKPAMGDLRARFSGNPGLAITVARNQSLGNLGDAPLLFRDSARMTPAATASSPMYKCRNPRILPAPYNSADFSSSRRMRWSRRKIRWSI